LQKETVVIATKEDIKDWFNRGEAMGAKHMLVMCDTYDHDDYPVFTHSDSECIAKYQNPGAMQRVMEVYDLSADKEEQLNCDRAMNLPKEPA
jgi:hypothetical protein